MEEMKNLTLVEYKELSEEEQLKYVYKYCTNCGWRTKEMMKLADCLGVNVNTIRRRGKRYASRFLNKSEEELKSLTSDYAISHNLSTRYYDLFKRIISMDDRKEITALIEQGGYDLESFKHKINEYVYKDYPDLTDEQQKSMISELRKKVVPYGYEEELENRKLQRKKQELDRKLGVVYSIFTEIIELELSKKEATKKYFNNCYALYDNDLEYVKIYFPGLYKKYIDFKDRELNKEIERYNYVVGEVNLIAGFLKNGIAFDNYFRDFDIIDFYELFDITIDELFKVSGDDNVVSHEERALIRKFIKKYVDGANNLNATRIEKFVTRREEIDCQRDEKDFPIVGTGYVIPEEEKRKMIQYLMNNKLPLTDKNYYALLTRYKNEIVYVRNNDYKERILKKKNDKN